MVVTAPRTLAAVTVYQDLFNDQQNINSGGPYTQTLAGSVPTVRNAIAGGSASATWLAGVETGGWGQRDHHSNGVATPTSSSVIGMRMNRLSMAAQASCGAALRAGAGRGARSRRRLLPTTSAELRDMPSAACHGATRPAAAAGMASRL